jgi:hypothetical protein
MRASMAYLAGAGTIVVAIAIGLGGGLVAGNIMNPHQPKQGPTSKVERQASTVGQAGAGNTTEVAPPSNAGSVKAAAATPVPYAQATQRAGFVATPLPSADNTQQAAAKPAAPAADRTIALSNAQPEPAASVPAKSASVEQPQEPQQAQQPPQPQAQQPQQSQLQQSRQEQAQEPQPAASQPQRTASQPSKPEQAYAKASASEVKREAREHRRAERHERLAQRPRREWRERDIREPREAREWGDRGDRVDWGDVDRSIREDDHRDYAYGQRSYPQFRLFGED